MQFLPSSPGHRRIPLTNSNAAQQKRPKFNFAFAVICPEFLANAALANAAVLPTAIQPLESLSTKAAPRVVPKNQLRVTYRGVSLFIPILADTEVPKHITSDVRFERNLHKRIEEFGGFGKVRIATRCVYETELRKLTKQRQITFEMMNKVHKRSSRVMDIGERHHRRGRSQEHRELRLWTLFIISK